MIDDPLAVTSLFETTDWPEVRNAGKTNGKNEWVKRAVSLHLAHDTKGTLEEARQFREVLDRLNGLIIDPTTSRNRPVLQQRFREEINVNAGLLFGLLRYRQVAESYINDLEARIAGSISVKHITSATRGLAGEGLTDRAFQETTAARDEREMPPLPATGGFKHGLIQGVSDSRGIAIGRLSYTDTHRDGGNSVLARTLNEAIDLSTHQLQDLQRRVNTSFLDVAAMIFSSHLLMLSDECFIGEIMQRHAAGTPAVTAVQEVVESFSRRFQAIPDPRFQEKAQDVQDLGNRIIHNMENAESRQIDYQGRVIAAHEIFPSELVKLHLQNVEGIILSGGGPTSHVAILAQSLDLPLVATEDSRLFSVPEGTEMVVDAEEGSVIVGPSEAVCEVYRRRIASRRSSEHLDEKPIAPNVLTSDGTAVRIMANVNLLKDALAAYRMGAHGIGLYRSEFPFLIRNGFPSEEEQFALYTHVVENMPVDPVQLRTLDLGGDKLLGSQIGREDNSFLGCRGTRFLLEHREILRDQLRAMLRAGVGRKLGIQFPMIGSMEEFLTVREEVFACIDALKSEGIPCNSSPSLGVVIELPAAVEIAPELASEADFLSVGTNDLIMYTLAADRTNHQVANIYRPIHPAVLRALKRVIDAAAAAETPLSICGATAADPVMITFYLGTGVTALSVDTEHLRIVANYVASVDTGKARELAEMMLKTASRDELRHIADGITAVAR